jgi:hypothetical protein
VAVVLLGREDQVEPDDLFEVAARNRGVNVQVFTDPEAADRWLGEQPSRPQDEGDGPPKTDAK